MENGSKTIEQKVYLLLENALLIYRFIQVSQQDYVV